MKRVLVLGGSGFIGTHLLRLIAGMYADAKIVAIDVTQPAERLPGVDYELRDARQRLPTNLACPETVIFNLAALRTFPGHSDAEYFDTNVGTTRRVLELAEASGCRSVVFTSTMSVYPTGEGAKAEDSPTDPLNAYGASKLEAEHLHERWQEEDPSRRLVVCRPAVIFGVGDNGNFTRLANSLRGGYFVFVGRKNTIKSAGYVTDLVRSLLFALERTSSRTVYNFCYPDRLTIGDIVENFCAVGGFRVPRLVLPPSVLRAFALPFDALALMGINCAIRGSRLQKLYESTNILPLWLQQHGFEYETSLSTALAHWRDQSPGGRFR